MRLLSGSLTPPLSPPQNSSDTKVEMARPKPNRGPLGIFTPSGSLPFGFGGVVIRLRGQLIIFGHAPLKAVILLAHVKCHHAVGYVGPTKNAIKTAKRLRHAHHNNGLTGSAIGHTVNRSKNFCWANFPRANGGWLGDKTPVILARRAGAISLR